MDWVERSVPAHLDLVSLLKFALRRIDFPADEWGLYFDPNWVRLSMDGDLTDLQRFAPKFQLNDMDDGYSCIRSIK
jgi:hypothetical protein